MKIEELRKSQLDYEFKRIEYLKVISKREIKRKEFVQKYNLEFINKMEVDDYIIGKGSKSSFCHWIEEILGDLGNIKGGVEACKKFGLYFGKTIKDNTKMYRFLPKFSRNNYTDAFESIRCEIINLLNAGKKENYTDIKRNLISPMFKGKILATYYPDKYLNIFSYNHLDHFLSNLNLKYDDACPIMKSKTLLDFKRADEIMEKWSIYEFSEFLYFLFGAPLKDKEKEKLPNSLKPYLQTEFPPLNKINAEIIELEIENIIKPKKGKHGKGGKFKTDFEKEKDNKRLGDRGEEIVKDLEKEYLISIGKTNYANKVDKVSGKNDNIGYDILSYDEYENEKYIEVKSTKNKSGITNFFISSNELNKANELNNYYIYIVFEAHTDRPKIWKIYNPFKTLENNKISIIPNSYRVQINSRTKVNR